jgi:hypothetical protein
MTNAKCPACLGIGWVCENRPKRALCQCGAGMPCEYVSVNGLEELDEWGPPVQLYKLNGPPSVFRR